VIRHDSAENDETAHDKCRLRLNKDIMNMILLQIVGYSISLGVNHLTQLSCPGTGANPSSSLICRIVMEMIRLHESDAADGIPGIVGVVAALEAALSSISFFVSRTKLQQ
jgi:hypothetical protein